MMKFYSTTWLLVLSVMGTTSEVEGQRVVPLNVIPDIWGNNGLLARNFRPTQFPTVRPTEPTASPTESPAPSPSPSENPTITPGRVTDSPTEAPTESPAPSPSPSANPSSAPTTSPSGVPSASPSISFAPSMTPTASSAPSATPTISPSGLPSASPSTEPTMSPTTSQPSDGPSSSPTDVPSVSPSAAPTDTPSEFPSDAPSMSPTSVTDRTKTATSTLLLEAISGEMDRMTLAEFELFTLDFLRKKIVAEDNYVLNTLAVTILSQQTAYNNATETNPPSVRNLESETWSVGLEVEIRTVSVVTSGRVPVNFNFTKEVLYAFYDHWDQYLYQLGNSVEFFNPLIGVSDWEPVQLEDAVDGEKGKASFVVAVMFSFVAFGLAVAASYVAIRKHMRKNGMMSPSKKKKSRGILFSPKNSPMSYSGAEVINYLTQTMSDEKNSPNSNYHDGDVEGGGALALMRNMNIDVDEHGMESVFLSPRAKFRSPTASVRNGLFVVDEVSDDDQSPVKSPMANSPTENTSRIGGQIKKWLTPRGLQGGYGYASAALSNRRLSSDPPENQSILGYNYGKDHMEPDAVKASTKNNAGVYTTDKSTIDGRSKATGISYNKKPASEEGQFTLPISFFSNRGPGTNASGVDSPMSSLADSNASSFFAIGNMNKSFVGQKSATGAMEDEGYEVSALKVKTNNLNLNNVAPIRQTDQDLPTETNENTPQTFVQNLSPNENSAKNSSVKLAAKRFNVQQQQQPLVEIQPPNSTVGVETILGARSRDSADDDEDKMSSVSSSFLKNRSIFSPNKRENTTPTNQPQKQRYGKVNVEVQEQETTRSVTSHSTLGARRMERKEEDRDDKSTMSTLSSMMRRPGCYDVYAPSGPIGIVVDTSKDGPSVHSLKSTSPMLGLISPGDLIIALDGEDTRKMTAAALTRLMARKSRLKERKITLLS